MDDQIFEEQIDVKKIFFKYSYYWKYFLFFTIISLTSAYLYIRYTNPVYLIESKVKLLDENKGLKLPSELMSLMTSKSEVNMENEVEVMKSKRLFEPVISELNLTTSYFYKGKFRNTEIWEAPIKVTSIHNKDSIFIPIEFNIAIKKNGYIITHNNEKPIFIKGTHSKTRINKIDILIEPNANWNRAFSKMNLLIKITPFKLELQSLINEVSVEKVGRESEILSIKIQDHNVNKSIDIINRIVDVFNQDGVNDRRLVNKKTVEFIDDRFKNLTSELDSIENEKKDFKRSKDMSFIEADAEIDISRKANSDQSLFQIETQIELSNLLKDALNNTKLSILPANIGLDNTIINELISQFNTLLLQRDRLIKTAGNENPMLKNLDSQIAVLKNNIDESITTYNKQLKITLNQQRSNFSKSRNIVADIPINEKILRSIERQQKIKENLYLLLLQKREESAIAYAVTAPSIKIIDYANATLVPIKPKKSILFLAALLIGVIVPFGIIYLSFLFDSKIKDVNDIGFTKSQIPIIAEIPFFKDLTLFKDKNDRSVNAEIFRLLSSNANFSLPVKESNIGQVILITSSVMGEGKTFIAKNLALALVSYNKKVLLIGADMRMPKLHSALNMDNVDIGLSSYLHNNELSWKEVLIKNNPYNENLNLIFSGHIPPNPSAIISNGRFETLITEAKLEYDYIIVDTAPTIYVNDTFLISYLADLTIYVTRFNYTDKKLLTHAKNLKDSIKFKNMVFILNGINQNNAYNFGYGYEYGYNNNSENRRSTFLNNPIKFLINLYSK